MKTANAIDTARVASVLASGAAAEIDAERPTPNARAGREPVPGAEADRRA